MTTTTHAVGTTPAEAAALAATAAALAAGEDPFGDNDDVIVPDDDDEGDDGAADAADDEADDSAAAALSAVDGEADPPAAAEGDPKPAAAAAEPPKAVETAPAARYEAGDPADFTTKRAELKAEKAKAFKDYSDGVIDAEAYSTIEGDVTDQLDALTRRQTLHEANVQSAQQTQASVLEGLMTAGKAVGVDYTDQKVARRFDAEMALLAADGDTRPYAQQAAAAHATVLKLLGKEPAAPKPTVEPAKPRENGKPPLTLRNVPAADVPNTGGGWQEQMSKLSGSEYEAAFARLPAAQKAQLRGE